MHAITEPLALLGRLWQRPTGATVLCRVGRWDRDHLHASVSRLAVEDTDTLAPADSMRGLCQTCARATLNVQGFMRDHAIVAYQLARDLVAQGTSLIGDVPILLGQSRDSLLAAIASLLLARRHTLRAPDRLGRLGRLAVVARRDSFASVGCHQEHLQSQINAGGRQWRGRRVGSGRRAGEDDVPAIRLARAGDRLDRALDGPMQFDFDAANALKGDQ